MEHVIGSLRIRDNDTCTVEADGRITPKLKPVGWKLIGDWHCFDHMTYIPCGKFNCKIWDGPPHSPDRVLLMNEDVVGPYWFNVAANLYHDFECLESGILHCIFASRDPVTHEVCDTPNDFQHASGLYSADWLTHKANK